MLASPDRDTAWDRRKILEGIREIIDLMHSRARTWGSQRMGKGKWTSQGRYRTNRRRGQRTPRMDRVQRFGQSKEPRTSPTHSSRGRAQLKFSASSNFSVMRFGVRMRN
jgi:hypothetical protein